METEILGGAAAFAIGFAVSYINYKISLSAFKKNKTNAIYISIAVRQAINLCYLVGAYFSADLFAWSREASLLGAALGITLPSAAFTRKIRDYIDQNTKEGENNG